MLNTFSLLKSQCENNKCIRKTWIDQLTMVQNVWCKAFAPDSDSSTSYLVDDIKLHGATTNLKLFTSKVLVQLRAILCILPLAHGCFSVSFRSEIKKKHHTPTINVVVSNSKGRVRVMRFVRLFIRVQFKRSDANGVRDKFQTSEWSLCVAHRMLWLTRIGELRCGGAWI